jgi:hypothetical protein
LALPPTPADDSFIREVDEEYRRDRLLDLWRRYGRWLLIAIGLGLIAFAGYLFWRDQQAKRAGELGEAYALALDQVGGGNLAAAEPTLKRMEAQGGGYATLAKLTRAADATRAGQLDRASALYDSVARDGAVAEPWRDYAAVQAVAVRYDRMTPAQAVERLRPLVRPGEPFFASAGEMLAVAYLRQGKPELAGPLFAQIARDQGTPPSLRARVGQMASMLGINIVEGGAVMGDPASAPANDTKAE